MSAYLVEIPEIRDGLIRLKSVHLHIAGLCPDPLTSIDRTVYDDPFRGLVKIVAGQQVSTKAAAAICARIEEALGTDFGPADVARRSYDDLRGCGLSGRKVEYIQNIAAATQDGRLDLDALPHNSDEDISAAITALKGFGQWSADMFLLFGLGRANVWADGDLGVRLGLQVFLGQDDRPTDAQMRRYGDEFSPHGTAASLLMWHIKHHEKK